jgi:hypothetical protein
MSKKQPPKLPRSKSVVQFQFDDRFRGCAKELVVSADTRDPDETLARYGYTEARWRAGVEANAECKVFLDACYLKWHSTANAERRIKNQYSAILEKAAPVLEGLIKSPTTPASAAVKGIETAQNLATHGTTPKHTEPSGKQFSINIKIDDNNSLEMSSDGHTTKRRIVEKGVVIEDSEGPIPTPKQVEGVVIENKPNQPPQPSAGGNGNRNNSRNNDTDASDEGDDDEPH